MTPLSFDAKTAREFTGDGPARELEAKARADADTATFSPPKIDGGTYQEQVMAQMAAIVYLEQFTKRLARNERKRQA